MLTVRLPMPDGFTPVSISLFDAQINLIATRYTLRGINVLVHCRGGVGRAGLTACAWAIKMGHVQPHPSLGVVEQRAMEQARERAEQVLAQQRRVEQQQQQQSATPTARGYKGFSLFPRSASSQTFNAAAAASSLPMDRAASGRYTSSTAGNADPGSFGTATTDHNAPAPTPDVPTLALPAELEHQIVMSTVERVIAMIRARRGLKAIESFEQVQFLVEYVRWLRAESR
jgi:protein-tyrosine phosphatase